LAAGSRFEPRWLFDPFDRRAVVLRRERVRRAAMGAA
jgi:hypothetical protein